MQSPRLAGFLSDSPTGSKSQRSDAVFMLCLISPFYSECLRSGRQLRQITAERFDRSSTRLARKGAANPCACVCLLVRGSDDERGREGGRPGALKGELASEFGREQMSD